MLLPNQLLVSGLIILSLSCNNTHKQKEQVSLPGSTKDTSATVSKTHETRSVTTTVIQKKPIAFKVRRAQNLVVTRSDIQSQTSLDHDFKTIEQRFQEFVINPAFDTTLLCKEGTTIKVMHSSFLREPDFTEVKSLITFQVKEFYKISDILSARLTTYSTDRILETGGMLFIQAISGGQLCKLKDNSVIEISFPFTEKKDGMLLFSGSWKNQKINWEPFASSEANQKKTVGSIAVFPGGNEALRRFLVKNLVYPDSLSDMGIGGMVQMDFVIDETGTAKDVNFKNRSQKAFKDAILNTFSKMPRWKPAERNGVSIKSTYHQVITFYNEEQNVNDSLFKKDFEAANNDANINEIKTADIRKYIFSSSKLGWINCDRFYNSPKPGTDFYVDCGNYTELDVKLVFHSFKAILNNYASGITYKFQNIPGDEAITIVVVKKINNDTFISLTESNTNMRSINNLVFEKVTMGKLKQKLEQLNNAW